MKRIIIIIALLIFMGPLFIFYKYQQAPTVDTVLQITDKWSPAIEEVYDVKKVDGDWLAFLETNIPYLLVS